MISVLSLDLAGLSLHVTLRPDGKSSNPKGP